MAGYNRAQMKKFLGLRMPQAFNQNLPLGSVTNKLFSQNSSNPKITDKAKNLNTRSFATANTDGFAADFRGDEPMNNDCLKSSIDPKIKSSKNMLTNPIDSANQSIGFMAHKKPEASHRNSKIPSKRNIEKVNKNISGKLFGNQAKVCLVDGNDKLNGNLFVSSI